MKGVLVKHIFVFLFVFSVMEKAGISVMSFLAYQGSKLNETEILSNQPESASTETEGVKEASLKEYFICILKCNIPSPLINDITGSNRVLKNKLYSEFYSSVLTPPPNTNI